MSMKDLFFLYCMLYNWKHPSLRPHITFFVMNNLAKIVKNPKVSGTISIGGVITSIIYFYKVLNEGEPIYRVVEPGPTKVNLNQLVIGKVLRKEGHKYFQIGPHSNRLPLLLPIKVDPRNLDTWADPAMYLTVANLVPPIKRQHHNPPDKYLKLPIKAKITN
jgi:hypothetical protein